MATIEVTAAIRRGREDIFEYLHDLSNYRHFLPDAYFSGFVSGDAVGGRNAAELKWRALGRWWPVCLELDSEDAGRRIGLKTRDTSMPFTWTWTLGDMKRDRRSERTEVHLKVEVTEPGGGLGRMVGGPLLERSLIKAYDAMMRRLEEELAGKPRSGLRPPRG